MLFFLREEVRFRRCRLLTFANVFLRNLLSFDSLVLSFLSLSNELVINCSFKNASNVKDANEKARFEMLKNANLFR